MTSEINMPLSEHETVANAISQLHNIHGMTWDGIAQKTGIPTGTLWDIANGKPIPKKWRSHLGLGRRGDLFSMPVSDLLWALNNREDISNG